VNSSPPRPIATADSLHEAPDTVPPRTPRIDSAKLLHGGRELVIEHAGREYRLRVTQNGKLILTA